MMDVKLALIANDRETVDGVQQYLLRAGARVSSTSWLGEAHAACADADAVILFADHYSREEALEVVLQLGVRLVIVVTAEVAYFSESRTAERAAPRLIVLPRPVWGWMLLDAVRSGMGPRGQA